MPSLSFLPSFFYNHLLVEKDWKKFISPTRRSNFSIVPDSFPFWKLARVSCHLETVCCRLAVKSHVLLQGLLFPRTIAISNERHAATFNRNACSLDPVNKVKPVWPARPRRELRHDGTIIVGKGCSKKSIQPVSFWSITSVSFVLSSTYNYNFYMNLYIYIHYYKTWTESYLEILIETNSYLYFILWIVRIFLHIHSFIYELILHNVNV